MRRSVAGNRERTSLVNLGAFSLSLNVKDIAASEAFYEKLGFTVMGGDRDQGWLIMKGPTCVLGLFQGMFDKNMMTFNPGWDSSAEPLDDFTDVRDIQRALKKAGVPLVTEADENTSGPASFMVTDPDGNPILIDQHR